MIRVSLSFCFLYFLVTTIICANGSFSSQNKVEIHYFVRLANLTTLGPSNESVIPELKLKIQQSKQYFSVTFKVARTYILNRIAVQFEKCRDSKDDCENFQAWNFTRFCRAMMMKNQMWSPIMNSVTPKTFFHTCPRFNQGIYKMDNFTLDIDKIVKFYNEAPKYYWKIYSRFYNQKGEIEDTIFIHLFFTKYTKRSRINEQSSFFS